MTASNDAKQIEYIALAVSQRWTNVPYQVRERAGDKAIDSLREGKSISQCMDMEKRK